MDQPAAVGRLLVPQPRDTVGFLTTAMPCTCHPMFDPHDSFDSQGVNRNLTFSIHSYYRRDPVHCISFFSIHTGFSAAASTNPRTVDVSRTYYHSGSSAHQQLRNACYAGVAGARAELVPLHGPSASWRSMGRAYSARAAPIHIAMGARACQS